MKKVLLTLSGAIIAFYGSICAAQPTMAPSAEKLQSKLVQTALARNTERTSNLRLATMRVPQQETQFEWNEAEEEWTPRFHYTYTYNNQGHWQSVTERSLPENEEISRTIDMSYDAQGRELESTTQTWNGTEWENSNRFRNEYDANGHLKLEAEDTWINDSWQLSGGTRYTYTTGAGNRIEQSLEEVYIPQEGWVNSSRTVNTFTGSGTNPVSSITSQWENGAWQEVDRSTEMTYENGMLKSSINEFYDEEEEEWIKTQNTFEYTTDAANKTNTILISQAMQFGESWVPVSRITITTLTSGETYLGGMGLTELKSEFNMGTGWSTLFHIIGEIIRDDNGNVTETITKSYDMESEEFVNLSRSVYSDFININTTSSEKEILAAALQVYPNPTNDKLKIALDPAKVQGASLSIHSLTGQKVYELASLRGEAVVDMGHLPSGVYMVRVTGANNAGITRKIVKQ